MSLAISVNDQPTNMEVCWMKKGLFGVVWPYELRQYTVSTDGITNAVRLYATEDPFRGPPVVVSVTGYKAVFHTNPVISDRI